jgi:hypothetical protein
LACLGKTGKARIYSRTVGAARSADIYLQRRTGGHMDWVGRMICRALHIAVMLLRLESLISFFEVAGWPSLFTGASGINLPIPIADLPGCRSLAWCFGSQN